MAPLHTGATKGFIGWNHDLNSNGGMANWTITLTGKSQVREGGKIWNSEPKTFVTFQYKTSRKSQKFNIELFGGGLKFLFFFVFFIFLNVLNFCDFRLVLYWRVTFYQNKANLLAQNLKTWNEEHKPTESGRRFLQLEKNWRKIKGKLYAYTWEGQVGWGGRGHI